MDEIEIKEIKEMLRQVGGMMAGANSVELVQKIVDAYDNAAFEAYQQLIQERGALKSPEKLAKRAWEFADAMMAERAARGLGHMPKSGS